MGWEKLHVHRCNPRLHKIRASCGGQKLQHQECCTRSNKAANKTVKQTTSESAAAAVPLFCEWEGCIWALSNSRHTRLRSLCSQHLESAPPALPMASANRLAAANSVRHSLRCLRLLPILKFHSVLMTRNVSECTVIVLEITLWTRKFAATLLLFVTKMTYNYNNCNFVLKIFLGS